MIKLLEHLGMDVQAMTTNDWLGVFFALVAAIGMVVTYVMVFRPSNKQNFEAQSRMALDDEDPTKLGEKR
ncbi:MAG: cbb3-type cytochrome c oxidase subunit 3 [Gammaproteobacteria bacterium]|nr:cbb3-type cytochrome c oxidase subunit 3 [Gammaproteobacteria bacterium]MDD2928844.1 cbb3-type cytochrome c oxidase subunit 3 [Sideroxydans sp.]